MSELAIRDEVGIERTETALILPEGLDEKGWRSIGEQLGRAHRASGWWIGDWINYGEKRWGEKYEEALLVTGLSYSTLRSYASICRDIPNVVRHNKVSFRAHAAIAPLPDQDKVAWLEKAADEGWGSNDLRAALAPQKAPKISLQKRHAALIDSAAALVRIGEKWEREMTDALAPPEARKQLTVLRKAREQLDQVIEAVEYRAAIPHTFMGR
jgi:hypothetical protein